MLFNLFVSVIIMHFVADWIFQPRRMATRKSKKFFLCLFHGWVNGLFLFITVGLNALYGFPVSWKANVFWFLFFYTSCHTIQDWFIWKGYAWWKEKEAKYSKDITTIKPFYEDYWFYTTIAIDQVLHLIVIFNCLLKVLPV